MGQGTSKHIATGAGVVGRRENVWFGSGLGLDSRLEMLSYILFVVMHIDRGKPTLDHPSVTPIS
jgi:hypothetical protein